MNVETFRHIVCFKSPKFEICSCPLTFCTRECEAHHNGSILIRRPPSQCATKQPKYIYYKELCLVLSIHVAMTWLIFWIFWNIWEIKIRSNSVSLFSDGIFVEGRELLGDKKKIVEWTPPLHLGDSARQVTIEADDRKEWRRVKLAQNWTGKKQKPQKKA